MAGGPRGSLVKAHGVVLLLCIIGSLAPTPGLSAAASWSVQFEDVGEEIGVVFQHAGEIHDPDGSTEWPAFPEIMGSGACWADFDGDGYEDLYVANQRFNEKNPHAEGFNDLFDPTNRLFENDGEGGFVDGTVEAGVESRSFDHGCSAVDHDGDGDVDLLVYGFGQIKLFNNDGDGTFSEVGQEAGLDVSTACLPYECWTTCSAWVDYDGDGWLDVFVCTYLESDMEDGDRGPGGHVAQLNFLFRNNGDGTFTEVAEQAGVEGVAADTQGSKSLGALWFDADLDGWPDLYVANDQRPNEFYWNNGDGTFTKDEEAGTFDDRAGMGVASGDTTRSGYPDHYITHYQWQHNGFYENRGDGTFKDRSGEGDLANDWDFVGWGTHLVDLDRDGWLDIFAVNGHTDWDHSPYGQAALVFWQEPEQGGGTRWNDVSDESGSAILEDKVSRGAAFADHDLDGNVDVAVVNNANQTLQFLQGSGNTNAWIYIQPVQGGSNHQAIGARVSVEAGGVVQHREVQAGSSYMSQNTLLVDFGLGEADTVDRVTVEWPHGNTTVVEDLPVGRVVRVDRETGTWQTDTLSPSTQAVFQGDAGKGDWFRSGVTVDFAAQDRAIGPPSGLGKTEYRLDGQNWTRYDDQPLELPAVDGAQHQIDYRSLDKGDNLEPIRQVQVKIDLTPPSADHEVEGTPGSDGWWIDAELVLQATDALSGVDQIQYAVDGGAWTEYGQPVTVVEGEHVIEYFAVDRAGNEGPVQSVEVRVDGTPPDAAFEQPSRGTLYHGGTPVAPLSPAPTMIVGGTSFPIIMNATDETSGVSRLDLFVDEGHAATFHEPVGEVRWEWQTGSLPPGPYTLSVVATDRAGNVDLSEEDVLLVAGTDEPGLPQNWPLAGFGQRTWPGLYLYKKHEGIRIESAN